MLKVRFSEKLDKVAVHVREDHLLKIRLVRLVDIAGDKQPASHLFRCFDRQVYATFMEDPVGLRERAAIGVDNIMWASDYPHSETTWPNSKSLTDEWFTPIGDDDKARILWKNAAELYGLI